MMRPEKKKAVLMALFTVFLGLLTVFLPVPSIASDLPSFAGATGWINSPPLDDASLRGKVVLIDFWEYTCVNCVRTFPVLRRWYRSYAPRGLVMIGIHTPEFSFAGHENNVAHAVRKYHLDYPVAIDSDRRLWDRFHNHYWPAQYLFDRTGKLIFHTIGEGDDERMERAIREAIGVGPTKTGNEVVPDFPESMTPELYAGSERHTMSAPPGFETGIPVNYPTAPALWDKINLSGTWISRGEYVRPVFNGNLPKLTLPYHASGVRVVLRHEKGARPVKILVFQDGKPLSQAIAGDDIRYDRKGSSYLLLRSPRMYTLVFHQIFGGHTLTLVPTDPSVEIYSFTFDPS